MGLLRLATVSTLSFKLLFVFNLFFRFFLPNFSRFAYQLSRRTTTPRITNLYWLKDIRRYNSYKLVRENTLIDCPYPSLHVL